MSYAKAWRLMLSALSMLIAADYKLCHAATGIRLVVGEGVKLNVDIRRGFLPVSVVRPRRVQISPAQIVRAC
ncbi:hypothetical protein [Phaffia rhodozyma]|uniref:Uncharacterized protein n=1 Tax=Phaffia rhodozyma TaxID=264483 RepID=A0A0F7SM37_PHARH|nr:hypothetical protein [Phaffia rhodozyma]